MRKALDLFALAIALCGALGFGGLVVISAVDHGELYDDLYAPAFAALVFLLLAVHAIVAPRRPTALLSTLALGTAALSTILVAGFYDYETRGWIIGGAPGLVLMIHAGVHLVASRHVIEPPPADA